MFCEPQNNSSADVADIKMNDTDFREEKKIGHNLLKKELQANLKITVITKKKTFLECYVKLC